MTAPDTQGWHNATLVSGCLVLAWNGGIRTLTTEETRNLFEFLEEYKDEIGTSKDVILEDE